MIKHQLPRIYQSLLPKELLLGEVVESKATCDNCNWKAYQPDLKCCTFEPYLPNFLVGALFESPATSEGALESLREKITMRKYSLPIGMTPSVRYQVHFNERNPQDFGNRREWLCPYFNREQNNCGIWKNRGSVCTTFFCQSSYGKKGELFWNQMNDYLTYVEMALMEEVLVHLDFSPRQISDCLQYLNRQEGSVAELRSASLPIEKARKLWNGYFDEQEQFFRKTYQMVQEFDKRRFKEAMGSMGAEIEEKLLETLRKLQ